MFSFCSRLPAVALTFLALVFIPVFGGLTWPASAFAPIDSLTPTPYMGWNSYYGLGPNYLESDIKDVVDRIVSSGLRDAGYEFVWLDEGWWHGVRDANGNMTVVESRWPHGMAYVADYIHRAGLKAGIYTDAGRNGCGGFAEGSEGHYQQDMDTFAAWGFDAVKVDWCGADQERLDPRTTYAQIRDALLHNSSHRPMILNICYLVPNNDGWEFGPITGNAWRTNSDIGGIGTTEWGSILVNFDTNAAHPGATGPGHWNDPDYLQVQQWPLTDVEAQSQFSLWSMMASPLIIGANVRNFTPAQMAILKNAEVIAIDQDPLGVQAVKISEATAGLQVWSKTLSVRGTRAVALFNRSSSSAAITFAASDVGLSGAFSARDLWAQQDLGTFSTYTANVMPHAVVLLKIAGGTENHPVYSAFNAGGGAAGLFRSDINTYDGYPTAVSNSIDTGFVADPAPQSVYQSARIGSSTNGHNNNGLQYYVGNLEVGATYQVRLHFSENWQNGAGLRTFNVSINNDVVLSDLDVFAAAGNRLFTAVIKSFDNVVATQGFISINLTKGSSSDPMISGVEVTAVSSGGGRTAPAVTPAITSGGTATGGVGTAFGYRITATNNPTSYDATGLPAGVSVNRSSGLISGTPIAPGTSTAALSATNAAGTGTAALTVTVSDGLVLYWKLDETSGTTASDSSGNGNTGALINGGTWTAGEMNGGLGLNGTGPFAITATNLSNQFVRGSLTLALWFKANAPGVVVDELGQPSINTGWHDSQIEVLSDGSVYARVWNMSGVLLGRVSFGRWNHVALRYDNSARKLDGFLNGVPSAGSVSGGKSWPGALYYAVGASDSTHLGSGAFFNGLVDELHIYNRALSAAEVTALAANLSGNTAPVLTSAAYASPNPATSGQNVAFSVSASDAEGDPLTYAWNFGDGTTALGAAVSHAYTSATTYTATATVSDGHGNSVSSSTTVTVTSSIDAQASYVTTDATTQGNWSGLYGAEGYAVAASGTSLPPYARVTFAGRAECTWVGSTTDVRALLKAPNGSADRIAACWYADSFTIDINLTDGASHRVAVYGLDWDNVERAEKVEVLDSATGAILDVRTLSGFLGGKYVVWDLKGHLVLRITNAGPFNAVIGGLFFGPASRTGNQSPTAVLMAPANNTSYTAPATITLNANAWDSDGTVSKVDFFAGATLVGTSTGSPSRMTWNNVPVGSYALTARATDSAGATATSAPVHVTVAPGLGSGPSAVFLRTDVTTQGNWRGVYGTDGYSVTADAQSLPAFATITPTGKADWTWAGSTSDLRAPLRSGAGSSARIAACWYSDTSFQIDLALNDGLVHQLSLYALDWDSGGRLQTIDFLDPGTGALLDTRTMPAFQGGQHWVYQVRGTVRIRLTRVEGYNAVLSAIFFDSGTPDRVVPSVNAID